MNTKIGKCKMFSLESVLKELSLALYGSKASIAEEISSLGQHQLEMLNNASRCYTRHKTSLDEWRKCIVGMVMRDELPNWLIGMLTKVPCDQQWTAEDARIVHQMHQEGALESAS